MTEDDIRLAMELFGGTGYNNPLSQYNRSREIPKPAPKRKSALDAARFPTLGRGTQPQIGLEPELRDIDLKQREATIAGLSPLENLQAFGEGARTVGQAAVAGITQPFAELMGVPADKFYKAAIDLPETPGGIARGEQMIEGAEDFFGAMSESPLAPIIEKIPFSPYSPASAQAIDTGLAQAGKGLKMAGQQAKQAGRQTLEAGKDLAQAARAEFATPPTGAVQLQAQQAERNPLGMYSQAEQVALNLAQSKGTGNQFLAQISKAPGVKPAELEWTGLADFLKSKGDQPVTKQEIADHLARNRVQVEEVRLSGTIPQSKIKTVEDQLPEGLFFDEERDRFGEPTGIMRIYDSDGDLVSQADNPYDLMYRAGLTYEETYPDAKYGEYQLPGGSNYREVLLTLPQKVEKGFTTPNGAFFSEEDLANPVVRSTAEKIGLSPAFRNVGTVYESRHFKQPNILAHMRLNDRVDANGDKVLFVEEMQSDWGQQGREKGFVKKPGELPPGWQTFQDKKSGDWYVIDNTKTQVGVYAPTEEEAILSATGGPNKGLPTAPFVQNTEDWVNLSLKRLITDAVNNGYKKVAFINGGQASDRFDLSKQVDKVSYFPSTNTVVAYKGGNSVVEKRIADPKELEEVIGKEAANKLLARPTEKIVNARGDEVQSLSGVDLKVGGEGMKKFYDQIVPATANKLLKKLGGGKLEEITFPTRKADFDQYDLEDATPEEIAKLEAGKMGMKQLGFTITPEMVELVKKQGLPTFAAGGAVTMAKGGNPLKAAREGMQVAKKAMKEQRAQKSSQELSTEPADSVEKPRAPEIKKSGKLTQVEKELLERGGERQAKRLQRAADEIPGLEDQYQSNALIRAFLGRKGYPYQGVMTMRPGDFEEFAKYLGPLGQYSKENIENLRNVLAQGGSFDDVPFLMMDKKDNTPFIAGHEGRHRTRALEAERRPKTLVEVYPRSGLEMGGDDMPMKATEWLKKFNEALGKDRLVVPEDYDPATTVDALKKALPDVYAKGGKVTKGALSGLSSAREAMKAKRREERVQKNLEAYMGSKEKPQTYYHATQAPKDFREFDLEKRPTPKSAAAVFLTPSTDWANEFDMASMETLKSATSAAPRIMPMITRAKNTFDYENPEHVQQVMSKIQVPKAYTPEYVSEQISLGNWNFIEDMKVQQAIKDLGFDSFNVKEKGVKNLGVFDPADVKALFNRGSYDPTTADISKADGGKISADDIRQKLKNAFNFAGGDQVAAEAKPAEEPSVAEAKTSGNSLLERLRKYKIGGAVEGAKKGIKAASKAVKSAKPAKAAEPAKTESVIEDWQWRPTEQVTAEVGLKEVPDYIQGGYGEFMKGQQKRAQAGQMGVRDLIKAYTITRSSVNRSGLPRDTATKTGMKIPQTEGLVRPEGAFAEWLGSKQGQNYLKAADRGEVDEKAIADLQTKFAPFGMASVLADDMRWAVKNAPTLASNLSQTIVGDPQTYRSVSQQLQGIGPAKSGFLGSLVGRGDFPTLDARQLRLHTGAGGAEASKFMRRRGGLGGEQAVGRLAGRQEEMGLDIDPSLNPFYQHLTHHAVWDKVADEQTTHDDLVRAMMGYKDGGEVNLATGGGDLLKRARKGIEQAKKGIAQEKAKKDKPPPKFEPAPAIPKEQIRSMAERIAQQTTGEFVRQNPKTTQNPEGLSKVQFERTKAVKPNIQYNVPQKDAPVVDIEKYKDYLLVGVPGDITPGGVIRTDPVDLKPRATQELLGIDDVEFETPVGMYGGSRYGQESEFPEGLEAFWASGLSPARALQNSITRFSEAEGGRPVLGMFSKMSRPASSFSGHLMEGLLEYQHPERLPKKKIKELNEIVRRGTPSKQFPGFVGFEDPEKMRVQAMRDGKLRTHINNVLTMATLNKQLGLNPKKGLRSGLDVSAAMTIPELSGLEVGASGYSLGRMVPGADLRLSAHPTYSHDIPGEFLGRMPYHIPYELAFPRTTHFVRENIPSGELFNTMKGAGMKEQIDQQYIDQIKLYQQYMKELTGRKKGGLAKIKKAKVKNGN